jgi:hypothetical protein
MSALTIDIEAYAAIEERLKSAERKLTEAQRLLTVDVAAALELFVQADRVQP